MFSKSLLQLPGANIWLSLFVGLIYALGSGAEAFAIVIFLKSGIELISTATFSAFPLHALSLLLALRIFTGVVAHFVVLSFSNRLSKALSDKLIATSFDPELARHHVLATYSQNQALAQLTCEGIPQLVGYFTNYIPTFAHAICMIVVALIVVAPINWPAALVLCLGMLLVPMAANASRSKEMKIHKAHLKAYENVALRFEESLKGLTTLKIFNADATEEKKLAEGSEGFRKATMQLLGGQLKSLIGSDGVLFSAIALATFATALSASPKEVLIVAAVAVRLFDPERQFVYLAHSGAVAMRRADAYLEALQRSEAKEPAISPSDTVQNISQATPLRLSHLDFSYPDGTAALTNISYDFGERGLYAIVGPSGSGKSTLAKLISGQYSDYKGDIFAAQQNLSELSVSTISKFVTLISGTDSLISGSISQNLDWTETLDQKRLRDALEKVDIDMPLSKLIQEGSANVSGGQRQRLLHAKALLRETPIVIFDEATSALDAEHDEAIWKLYSELSKRSLVIVITHRLKNIVHADQVVALKSGKLAETGTPQELLELPDGLVAKMYLTQKRFEEHN